LLLLHSLGRLLAIQPGFSPNQVLAASLFLPDNYQQPGQQAEYFARLTERLRRQPGVSAAAAAFGAPLTGYQIGINFDLPDHPLPPAERPSTLVTIITPDYFSTLSIPLLQGRDFAAADRHLSPAVAIVNQSFARSFLAGRAAVGARITPSLASYPGPQPAYTVVGVVGDTRQSALSAPDPPLLYLPESQMPFSGMTLVVRFAPGGASRAASAIRAVTHDLDPNVPAFDLKPLSDFLSASLAAARLSAGLLALFASLALLLAAVGLYAVMAQAVAQRRREIGVRMALGADRRTVVAMVLREGLTMAAWGTAVGLAAAWALSRALAGMLGAQLYATSMLDPLAFAAAPLLLLATALLACFLPARRAAGADPIAALRLD
jgi:putative ABC transport system permease protein